MDRMAADFVFNHANRSTHFSRHQREINFFDRALGKLNRERMMRLVIFGNDQAAARVFVETMHNSGTLFPADSGQRLAMMKQRVDQRVLAVAGSRMDDQAGRFVNHNQIIVFMENFERDLFWPMIDLSRRWFGHLNDVTGPDRIARAGAFAV